MLITDKLADDLIVGAGRIAEEIGCTRRQAQHLIDRGQIPCCFKHRGKWSAFRSSLRRLFESFESNGGAAA